MLAGEPAERVDAFRAVLAAGHDDARAVSLALARPVVVPVDPILI
jgi:hypothetical protein